MMRTTMRGLLLLLVTLGPRVGAQSEEPPSLHEDVQKQVEAALASEEGPRGAAAAIAKDTAIRHGEWGPLLRFLRRSLDEDGIAASRTQDIRRLRAALQRKIGDLRAARRDLEALPEKERSLADQLALGEVLDALGQEKPAIAAYDRVLEATKDEELRNRLLLRKALLQKSEDEEKSALALFAAEPERDPALRNQAAIILSLTDQPKDAIELFAVTAEGSKRFAEEVRRAEWALQADQLESAQDFAWNAVKAAKLKRDRRYALTILAEAYRRAEKLDELAKRFEAAPELDPQSRATWIDVLRETGRVEDALRLFRESAGGAWTNDMRRELLEMCRETGQESILIDAYRRLITESPLTTEWREGLSRYWLERGDRPTAEKVWEDFSKIAEGTRDHMLAAEVQMKLGLDELAVASAERCLSNPEWSEGARLFIFELALDRGRLDAAAAALDKLDEEAAKDSPRRMDLADAYARLGNKKRAAEVMSGLRDARGKSTSGDLEMKLALMLSEVGDEEKALEHWLSLWRRLESIPRRRYVEERIMTVASRLGRLAKIAVELETRLADGKADDRESGLLVRLYTRVNDAVSAAEVIEEHMKNTGGNPVDVLAEKARVYLSCTDYFNYEKTVRELIAIDPENAGDYLRQLAMSNLERGQRQEAKEILDRLKGTESDSVSDEFEAGVLALAGLRDEAMQSYRRALARHPERIDTHLLLSNLMRETGAHDVAAGMFQNLAATAEKDDLFTVAIDGILNLRDGRANRGAPDRLVRWARRLVFERLARRPDKLYLYQLVSDLSEEVRDRTGAISALKAALPIAGEQRTALLRELMDMAKGREGGAEQRRFGRRLLGQGELVPPGVYLGLGQSFLSAGDVANATKTFNRASQLPEFDELQGSIAESFQKSRYLGEALRVYERMLSTRASDVGLITKVAQLKEQVGRDDVAYDLYSRGIELLMARRPFSVTTKKEKDESKSAIPIWFRNRNVDDYGEHYGGLLAGVLATLKDRDAAVTLLNEARRELTEDLARAKKEGIAKDDKLEGYPRVRDRATFIRRLAVAFESVDRIESMDRELLAAFPGDKGLLESLCRFRLQWGLGASARRLLEEAPRDEEAKAKLRFLVGAGSEEDTPGLLPVAEAGRLVLPLLAAGKNEAAKTLLERLDLSTGDKADLDVLPLLVSASAFLEEQGVSLTLLRHWINQLVRGGGNMYGGIAQILKRGALLLDKDQHRGLVVHLVDTLIAEPDKSSALISRLPDLQKQVSVNLLTSEQLVTLIEARLEKSSRGVWGLAELFKLIPAADRPSTLRAIFPKIAKSERAFFLLQLLPALDDPIEESFAEFLVGSFEGSIKDVTDEWQLDSVSELAGTSKPNLPIALRFVKAARKKEQKKTNYAAAEVGILDAMDKKEEAREMARGILKEILAAKSNDWRVRNATNRLFQLFGKEGLPELLKVFAEVEAAESDPLPIAKQRLRLIRQQGGTDAWRVALDEVLKKHPKDEGLRRERYRDLLGRGDVVAAIGELEAMAKQKPKDMTPLRDLVTSWWRLRNAPEALKAFARLEKLANKDEKKDDKDKDGTKKIEPDPVASLTVVKKSLDDGDEAAARRVYRRLWRIFPRPGARRFSPFMRHTNSRSMNWPAGKQKKREAFPDPVPGGLPKSWIETKEKQDAAKKEQEKPKKVFDVLSEHEFGLDEMQRQLRSFDPRQLDQAAATDMYRILAKRRVAEVGREAALEALLERERAGAAGKREYGILFALLEEDPESAGAGDTVEGLLQSLDPKDNGQVRRLARLSAAMGRKRQAAVLYRWCGINGGGGNSLGSIVISGGGFIETFGGNRSSGLLQEVSEALEGEDRDRVIEALLESARPSEDSYWGRDDWEARVLNTWERLLGKEAAVAKCADLLEGVTKSTKQPKRRACAVAARLLAHVGQHDRALECLEVATCKLEAPPGLDEWLADSWGRFGYFSRTEIQRMFPRPEEGTEAPVTWWCAVAQRLREWEKAGRIADRTAFEALALITLRLGEHEKAVAARAAEKTGASEKGEDSEKSEDDKKAEYKKAEDKKADDKKADDKKVDDEKADDKKADDKKADDKKADDKKADDKKADDKKADDKKADDEKSDDKTAEDKKADDEKADDEKADDEKADDEKADDEKADDEKADDEGAPATASPELTVDALLGWLTELAGEDLTRRLWVADVARHVGRIPVADGIERTLLEAGRLRVARIAPVITRLEKSEGAETAYALGQKAAETARDPALLRGLSGLATRLEDEAAAKKWSEAAEAAEKAESELKEKKMPSIRRGSRIVRFP